MLIDEQFVTKIAVLGNQKENLLPFTFVKNIISEGYLFLLAKYDRNGCTSEIKHTCSSLKMF